MKKIRKPVDKYYKKYQDHLRSKYWKSVREKIIKSRVGCELCGKKKKLQVHHLNYAILFKEDRYNHKNYLMLTCDVCHEKIHKDKRPKYKMLDPKRNDELALNPNWRRWTRFYCLKKFNNQWWKFWL